MNSDSGNEAEHAGLTAEHLSPLPWPPTCDKCSTTLTEPGAVILTPPNGLGRCTQGHLCVSCFGGFMTWLMGGGKILVSR